LVIGILTLVVVGIAIATRRWQRPSYNPVSVAGHGFPEGYVVFTSTDCTNCKTALARLKQTGAPIREVTWELEAPLIEEIGVEAVPHVVYIGPDGQPLAQTVGIPSARWLRRMTG